MRPGSTIPTPKWVKNKWRGRDVHCHDRVPPGWSTIETIARRYRVYGSALRGIAVARTPRDEFPHLLLRGLKVVRIYPTKRLREIARSLPSEPAIELDRLRSCLASIAESPK